MIAGMTIRIELSHALGWTAVAALVLLLATCGGREGGSGISRLRAKLPDEALGWRAADRGELYDRESIFSYIDGHAEVYLAYGMESCLARRYSAPSGRAISR
jgi:hypothetical protein